MMRKLTNILILALAAIAAIVATGLIMGWSMWAWIVAYWLVLTVKNALDFAQAMADKRAHALARRAMRQQQEDCDEAERIYITRGY